MYRSMACSLALLMCCATVRALEPRSNDLLLHQAIYSQRMAALAPSLRQWVAEEGHRCLDSGPDVEGVGEAVRTRLSGQIYKDTDVDILVQLVFTEAAKDADADLRAAMDDTKAANERKKAQRDAAQTARQAQQQHNSALRGYPEQRTQPQSSAPTPATTASALRSLRAARSLQAEVAPIRIDKDSLSELSEEDQLKMQMHMDRRAQAYAALSNAMKKFSKTSSTIISNLK